MVRGSAFLFLLHPPADLKLYQFPIKKFSQLADFLNRNFYTKIQGGRYFPYNISSLMTLDLIFSNYGVGHMSNAERKAASILIVDSDGTTRTRLRQGLSSIGFSSIIDAPNHLSALQKIEQRSFTHVLFEAKATNMPVKEFIIKVLEYDPQIIGIPTSYEPTIDDVFDLLVVGARGFIVKPFTSGSLDEGVVMATNGEPISDSILYAKDRNEALASLIITSLDRLATVLRQAQQFETAKFEAPKRLAALKRAVEIGKTFAKGGSTKLLEAISQVCLERSHGPATQLGRLRKRAEQRRDSLSGAPTKTANDLGNAVTASDDKNVIVDAS